MSLVKRLVGSPRLQRILGVVAAEYLRLVWKTNRFVVDPPDAYERFDADLPAIVVFWHGQHFMTPFISRKHRVKVIISRHRDGEINAVAAERLGIGTIRGSGSQDGDFHRRGGARAFRAMLEALAEGTIVASTADVPKVSRVASLGIVKLAAVSGRPIYPVAITTSRYKQFDTWDRSVLSLPFGRGAIVWGDRITVARDADEVAQEAARLAVEEAVNRVTRRAEALVARPGSTAPRAALGSPDRG
jgi:lysophospholipid acyltransferase (LPLAT)-like uncharacterized protein